MWIATERGFISVVQDRGDPDVLLVRARDRHDIEAVFEGAEVFDLPGADYLHRARVNRREVADTLHRAVMALDYDSHFKDVALERSPENRDRCSAYYGTWSAMAQMQAFAPYSLTPRHPRQQYEDEDYDEEVNW